MCLGSSGAWALGLGTATLGSSLGEPLRLSLPVTVQPDDDVGCIQVRARGDDLPSVFNTRSNVVRYGSETRIEITSAQPVVEPTIGLVVVVGCTSPVSREFVVFLDPPVVAPRQSAGDETPKSIAEPTIPRRLNRPAPRRPDVAAAPPTRPRASRSGDAVAPALKKTRPARPPIAALPTPAPTVADAAPTPARQPTPPVPSQPTAPATGNRDRLSIAPQVAAPAAQTPPATTAATGSALAPATAGGVGAGPASGSVPAATAPPAEGTAAASAAAANATADVELMAREQALRQQRDALQARISKLNDQIDALRAQTATLTTRNQALEDSIIAPVWFWLLAALALIAILAAAWMTRSYLALRRSVESSDWWAATQASAVVPTATDDDDLHDDLVALDAGTRMGSGIARPIAKTDFRASQVMAPTPVVSNVDRSRTITRAPTYQPAIETDFTVSDIEVAMAAVRTVSPPRTPPPNLSDSDLGQLGGPTEPLPYSDPPPAAPSPPKAAMPPVSRPAFASDVNGDPLATFADLNVPPMEVNPQPPKPAEPAGDSPGPLDFKLDIPASYDPLESDSFKRTEFDRTTPGRAVEFEETMPMPPAAPPAAIDFELPSTTSIQSGSPELTEEERHGATALDNLFATDTGKLGVDTILNLDERDNAALSASDVGRFTSTAIDNPSGASQATVQGRMSRFADLLNQVDEAAVTDPLRAIALLRQYVLRDDNIPTILWLRLFELYKIVGKKPVYEALAEHFSRRYRRPMIGWNETLSDRVPQTPLSAFKELDSQIEASWGMEIGLDRLQTLLCDYDQSDAIVFNAVLQRDLLDAAKIFLLDRDSSIAPAKE